MLVILDNMEAAGEPQNEIAMRLAGILGKSKALLISRHRFQGELYAVHLTGIILELALDFLLQEANDRGISRILNIDRTELIPIVRIAGGSPLAMKLLVGQLTHLPLSVIIDRLNSIRLLDTSTQDEYSKLFRYIFLPSWQLLSLNGKKLLLSLSYFTPGIGSTYDVLQAVSDLPNSTLSEAIDESWTLAFIEIGESPRLQQIRYYLHALTQYFLLSDIVQQLKQPESST